MTRIRLWKGMLVLMAVLALGVAGGCEPEEDSSDDEESVENEGTSSVAQTVTLPYEGQVTNGGDSYYQVTGLDPNSLVYLGITDLNADIDLYTYPNSFFYEHFDLGFNASTSDDYAYSSTDGAGTTYVRANGFGGGSSFTLFYDYTEVEGATCDVETTVTALNPSTNSGSPSVVAVDTTIPITSSGVTHYLQFDATSTGIHTICLEGAYYEDLSWRLYNDMFSSTNTFCDNITSGYGSGFANDVGNEACVTGGLSVQTYYLEIEVDATDAAVTLTLSSP